MNIEGEEAMMCCEMFERRERAVECEAEAEIGVEVEVEVEAEEEESCSCSCEEEEKGKGGESCGGAMGYTGKEGGKKKLVNDTLYAE